MNDETDQDQTDRSHPGVASLLATERREDASLPDPGPQSPATPGIRWFGCVRVFRRSLILGLGVGRWCLMLCVGQHVIVIGPHQQPK